MINSKTNTKIDFVSMKKKMRDNISIIISIVLLLILIGIVVFSGFTLFDIKSNYEKVQLNLQEIKKVQNITYIDQIKKKNLRTPFSIGKTAALISKDSDFQKYINATNKLFIFTMYNDPSGNFKNKINDQIFIGMNNLDNSEKEQIILNVDNNSYLEEKLGENINTFLRNYNEFKNSNYFVNYVNSVDPSSLNTDNTGFSDSMYKNIKNANDYIYIYELLFIQENLNSELELYKNKYSAYMAPYDQFLSHIFLPSLDIWKDKFSGKINVDIFGSEYLNKAAYIDLNLVRYWSEYFKSYKGKFYQGEKNRVDNILVDDMKTYKQDKSLANLGMKITFGLNSDKSFYGLISKLTSTSNKKNIMIISEFTHYLWENIKNNILGTEYGKSDVKDISKNYMQYALDKCLFNEGGFESSSCRSLFACKSLSCSLSDFKINDLEAYKYNIQFSGSLTNSDSLYNKIKGKLENNDKYDFSNSSFARYFQNEDYTISSLDSFVGYRMYDCLLQDGYCEDLFKNQDDNYYTIKKTIADFANCNLDGKNLEEDNICKTNFINKFDTNYFVAYTMVDKLSDENYNYIRRLKDVYKNMSGLLKIGEFAFKNQNDLSNGFDSLKYTSNTSLDVYYKNLTDAYLNAILNHIGTKECIGVSDGKIWSLDVGYNYINGIINRLYKSDVSASGIYELNDTLSILEELKTKSQKSTNLEKLLLNIQAYRILKEKGYCASNS